MHLTYQKEFEILRKESSIQLKQDLLVIVLMIRVCFQQVHSVVQHIPHVVVQTEHIQAPRMIELRKEASSSPWIRISVPLGVLSSMLII